MAWSWKPTPQMSRFPFAVVFGFLETFQSASTKRVIELEVNWYRNTRREEGIWNLVSDVKRLEEQVEVVEEEAKELLHERCRSYAEFQRRVKIEMGFAVCIVINVFCE